MNGAASSNAQSTSWAAQALVRYKSKRADRALAYLRSLQEPDGSVRYSSSSAQSPVWVTSEALLAHSKKPF
jgi:hypothetical protein